MNMDSLEGKWEQVKGMAKEKWGKLTDNDLLAIRGRADRLQGKIQERYGYTKERAEKELKTFLTECECDGKGTSSRPTN